MGKIAVVYWSGTGNTKQMAEQVANGVKNAGGEVSLFTSAQFSAEYIGEFDGIVFGCPSMGAEELEETEFGPLFEMCEADSAVLVCESIICNDAPGEQTFSACEKMGAAVLG